MGAGFLEERMPELNDKRQLGMKLGKKEGVFQAVGTASQAKHWR